MKLIDGRNHDLPLLAHPFDLESEFTPQALIAAVRIKRGLVSVAVPEVCILEFDGDLTDHLVQSKSVSPWRNWACFHTPMFALEVDRKPCGIVPRAIGGASTCSETIELVRRIAVDGHDVEIHDMHKAEVASRAKQYGVRSVPAVVIDGKLAGCCAGRGPDEHVLRSALA